jgi:hypothetical protein
VAPPRYWVSDRLSEHLAAVIAECTATPDRNGSIAGAAVTASIAAKQFALLVFPAPFSGAAALFQTPAGWNVLAGGAAEAGELLPVKCGIRRGSRSPARRNHPRAGRQVPVPSAVRDTHRNLHPEPQVNRPRGFPIHTHLLCLPHCSQAMNLGRQISLARVERANTTMSVGSLCSIALCRLCIASVLYREAADGGHGLLDLSEPDTRGVAGPERARCD